ncbi:MAG: PA domain-containing protein, partial [Acidimicrobiales bacterium]
MTVPGTFLRAFLISLCLSVLLPHRLPAQKAAAPIRGFHDSAAEQSVERKFLAVPDPRLAEEHLRTLTAAPHLAGTPEDKKTADYVAQKFRQAGLETEVQEYKVWLNDPAEISVDVVSPANARHHGPTRERVNGDPYQDDPRVVMPFTGESPSGDAEAEAVYVNYGRPEDFKTLEDMKIDVRGKILVARYGENFRGVKAYLAQEHGAAGLLLYSDPLDDGYFKGDKYPDGPWRPDTGVQRGSVGYMFLYPGDPTTPGVASVPGLPDSARVAPEQAANLARIPTTPLSYYDAQPILQNLAGPASPHGWQGGLPFTYHIGPGPARVKMRIKQDYHWHTIWDVIGKIPGSQSPDEWVVAGNHRDAWVYGAVDPN